MCVLLPLAMADADADAKADAEPGYGHRYGHRRYGHHGYGHHGHHSRSYQHVSVPSRPVQKCHTVYDTTYEKVCKTIHNKQCSLVPTTQYRTEVDNVCTNVPERVCVPTTQTVPDQQCATHVEQACTTEVHTTIDIALTEECQDIQHQVSMYFVEFYLKLLRVKLKLI